MIEIWKDIPNYEKLYKVSNLGRIKSYKRKEKILIPSKNKRGYLCVSLVKNNVIKKYYVHRIVAIAFLNNYENKRTINHIDGNKLNNCVDNLEWNTHSENIKHAYHNKLMKGNRKVVYQYDKSGNLLKKWDSISIASKTLNITFPSISDCCNKKQHRKTAGGYKWSFYKEHSKDWR